VIDVDKRIITTDEVVLFQQVGGLDLCVRARNCLCNANVRYIGELIQVTYNDPRVIKCFGRWSIADVSETLATKGLSGVPPGFSVQRT
jgi:DNA-directed RNA polymerase subunit alpha